MRPISELTFEHGPVLLRSKFRPTCWASGSMLADGTIGIVYSTSRYRPDYFTHFLPISEIAQLQEAGK